jgi:hypothetical protein
MIYSNHEYDIAYSTVLLPEDCVKNIFVPIPCKNTTVFDNLLGSYFDE